MTAAPSPRRPLTAGSEIDSWCTRCKMDLGHRIVAMVAQAPKRVVCMRCGSEHNYRAPKATAALPRAPRKTATASATSVEAATKKPSRVTSARAEWEKQVRSGRPMRRYATPARFPLGDLIPHHKCGDGYVAALLGESKVTIAFLDGERTLIHGAPA